MMQRENRRAAVRPLSAVGESEEAISELEVEAKLQSSTVNKENNKFEILCDGVLNSLSETQATLQDLLSLKDNLLLHYLPAPMLFRFAITIGKVYRAFSDMNTPVNELVRLVRIYSLPWDQNSIALKKLHEMYENKKHMLNIAIKRLTLVDKKTKLFDREKKIQNWEKLYIKLSEAKGHGRRWKFQIENFRKKASQGYDELLRWAKSESEGNNELRKLERKTEEKNENRESVKIDERGDEESDEDDKLEESDGDIGSDDDSFLSKSSAKVKTPKKVETPKPVPVTVETGTQTNPDTEEKVTWTGEPDYIRYFIVRLFKPNGLALSKLKCKIKLGETQFTSKYLDPPKPEKKVKIVENVKKKGRLLGNKALNKDKDKQKESKKEEQNKEEEDDAKKEENIKGYQDFVFTLDDRFKRKAILDTSIDNCIIFEMTHGENETVFAYATIQMDDLHTLELPILYYKMPSECKVIDYNTVDSKEDESLSSGSFDMFDWLKFGDLTEESKNIYEMLSQRQPITFPMHKEKTLKTSNTEVIGNLPLMLFWARKPIINKFEKNTGTQSIRDIVEELTGFDINKINRFEIDQLIHKNVRDSFCSPMEIPLPPRPPSTPIGVLKMTVEEVDGMHEKHTKEVQEIQENYQLQIDQLKLTVMELEDELTQLRSINELKTEGTFDKTTTTNKSKKVGKPKPDINKPAKVDEPKFKPEIPRRVSLYGKDLPEDFLERLKMFNEKSSEHHKEIIKKYFLEEASTREKQMSVQHRLDVNKPQEQNMDDFCLPAVFMPYKSNSNVFNPKAHQYFHPSGYTDLRLTQPPAVFQLPPLPSKSIPIINLFELGKRYQAGEPDYMINQYITNKITANATTIINNNKPNINNKNNDETSQISHQKPNSLASKNNTAMRFNFIDDSSSNIDIDQTIIKNEDIQEINLNLSDDINN